MDNKYRDHAVKPSPFLDELLDQVGWVSDMKRDQKALKRIASEKEDLPQLREELDEFTNDVLQAMGKLVSPGRRKIDQEEHNTLRARFVQVWRSYGIAKELLRIVACSDHFRVVKIRIGFFGLLKHYFQQHDQYKNYEVVRQWLYRQTAAGIEKEKKRNSSPERKKQIAASRPSKEAERERKRLAYWAKKGKEPPPKRGYVPVIEQIRAEEPSELDESDITSIFQDDKQEEPSTQETSVSPPLVH
jgi:hypothetical protein